MKPVTGSHGDSLREFSLSVLRPGAPEQLVPFADGIASSWAITARLAVDGTRLSLSLDGRGQAVVTLWMQPGFSEPFPLIPAFMLGDNRPEFAGPGFPQLTDATNLIGPYLQNPFWGIRSDRASAPVVFLFGQEGMRALGVPPYVDGTPTGLRVCKRRGIGISIGHVVEPVQFVHDSTAAPGYRGYHTLDGRLEVRCDLFTSTSNDRRGHSAVIRKLYSRDHQPAPSGEGIRRTVQLLGEAIVRDVLIPARTQYSEQTGGEMFKIKDWKPGRPVDEIGWTGGAMAAYPFLRLQKRLPVRELRDYAVQRLDRICGSINPQSGFFWDCQRHGRGHAKGWWTGLSPQAHYAYTQGHACYYLLRSADLVADRRTAWTAGARQVLDRVLGFQMKNGQFPVSFSLADGSPQQVIGFAGCWFAAALALLGKMTGEAKYLDAATRAVEGYHRDIACLTPCATPMDTHNAPDQEGNLALIHAAAALHETTGQDRFLEILADSAEFEMLWRYYYNTRPVLPPLTTADWGSSGGSVTSTHNPHIHPMHLNALDQVLYLYDRTGDDYYLQRTRDAVRYGCCCVCREKEDFGWGKPGWLCERFCPSDGLLIQQDLRTGEPVSVGCDYHVWVVAVTLEGFTGQAWDRFADM